MAGGLDCPYPPENIEIWKRIAEDGLLLSEISFGVEPTGKHFPRRNRLIAWRISSARVCISARMVGPERDFRKNAE